MKLDNLYFYISPDQLPQMDMDPPTYVLKVIGLINDYKVTVSRTFYTEESEDGLYLRFVDEEMETIKFILQVAGSKIVGQMNLSIPNLYEKDDKKIYS
jgi:hypothetical protein